MAVKTYTKGTSVKLSANFNSSEFDCHGSKCCSSTLIDEKLVTYLQRIRSHFNKPIIISSAYRCATHNRNVGGATGSRHSKGQAADIYIKGVSPAEIAKYAESIGVLGIGLYETDKDGYFVHIDTRTSKYFWYGQAQAYRSTFGSKTEHVSSKTEHVSSKTKYSPTVLEWQKAAIADGFSFPMYGADGIWGSECENVAKNAICKMRNVYKYKNLTKLVQKIVGVNADGMFGSKTKLAVVKWQIKNGLVANGEFGINCYKKAFKI
jgi:hypothetical protein